jgi:hypothetical protein
MLLTILDCARPAAAGGGVERTLGSGCGRSGHDSTGKTPDPPTLITARLVSVVAVMLLMVSVRGLLLLF